MAKRISKEVWDKAEKDYINGINMQDICKKYSIEYQALNSRINRYKWKSKKDSIQEKANQKSVESNSDELAKRQTNYYDERYNDCLKDLESLNDNLGDLLVTIKINKDYSLIKSVTDLMKTRQMIYDGMQKAARIPDKIDSTIIRKEPEETPLIKQILEEIENESKK